jgi:hypothetical protein
MEIVDEVFGSKSLEVLSLSVDQLSRGILVQDHLVALCGRKKLSHLSFGDIVGEESDPPLLHSLSGHRADVASLAHVLPFGRGQELAAQRIEPTDVAVDELALHAQQRRVALILRGELVAHESADRRAPRAAAIDDRSPDLASFPKTVVGAVVLETQIEGNGGADHRKWQPRNGDPDPLSALIEDCDQRGPGREPHHVVAREFRHAGKTEALLYEHNLCSIVGLRDHTIQFWLNAPRADYPVVCSLSS